MDMKDTLRLLPFHLHMLPYAVTIGLFPLLKRREEKGPGKCGGAQIASHS
jgi:hypothetical protein